MMTECLRGPAKDVGDLWGELNLFVGTRVRIRYGLVIIPFLDLRRVRLMCDILVSRVRAGACIGGADQGARRPT